MSQIRVLIVDDHSIVRQGIRSLLSNYPDFKVIAEADNGQTALTRFQEFKPDVTLLDISMPGESGLDVLQQIRQGQPAARVLMLTSYDDDEYVIKALRSGAYGFILKSASDEILVNAIQAVYQGEYVLSSGVTGQVVKRVFADPPPPTVSVTANPIDFADEELQIIRMLVQGASNADIATQLYMSHTSVKRKLRKIFTKMNIQTRAQAAAEAVRQGLV